MNAMNNHMINTESNIAPSTSAIQSSPIESQGIPPTNPPGPVSNQPDTSSFPSVKINTSLTGENKAKGFASVEENSKLEQSSKEPSSD